MTGAESWSGEIGMRYVSAAIDPIGPGFHALAYLLHAHSSHARQRSDLGR